MSSMDVQLLFERLGKHRLPICIALGAVAVAYAFFIFRPGQIELGRQMAEVERLRLETLQGSREADGLLRLEDEIAVAQTFLTKCEEGASTERRRGELLSGLSRAAEESGLALRSMQPEEGTRYETFRTDSVRLEATGRYGSFVSFLAKVQKLPFAIQVQECRLTAAEQVSLGGTASREAAAADRSDLAGSFVFAVFAGSSEYSVSAGQALADR